MATNIAFFLSVPASGEADPYVVTAKYGPAENLRFNYGISVEPQGSAPREIRAVCPGWISLTWEGTNWVVRLEPTIRLSANGWEQVTAFEYRGVDRLLPELLAKDHARVARVFSSVGDVPPTLDEFRQRVEGGELRVQISGAQGDDDTGIAIASVSREIEFRVITSRTIRPFFGEPNHCDPAAFWAFHMSPASGQLRDADRAFVSAFVQTNFAGRSVLEIRDEYNTPITNPSSQAGYPAPAAAELTYDVGSGAVSAVNLARGVLVLQRPAGGEVELRAASEYCLWDSFAGTSASFGKLVTVPSGPAHIVVLALKPADWFAPQQAEFDPAFPAPARRLERYTRGNKLQVLVDGKEYFDDLSAELNALEDGPSDRFWHHAGWSLEPTYLLDRIGYYAVSDFINRYRDSLVLMLWKPSAGQPSDVSSSNSEAIGLSAPDRYLHDKKVNPISAVHMKVVTLKNRNGLVGYCGGIDVWPDRETDRSHTNSTCDDEHGQHDVQLKVQGPAAADLDLVLHHRWADQKGSSGTAFAAPAVQGPHVGETIIAQVARTVPLRLIAAYGYAKDGDFTLNASFFNAISRAKSFIYIEDQYFANGAAASALRESLARGLRFLIVVLPYKNWDKLLTSPPAFNAKHHLDPLRRDYPDRVRVCYLQNQSGECIYVHAKLMIVDDLFVSCGSANIDHRGLGTDLPGDTSLECNLMCVDEKVNDAGSRQFPRRMRMKLWAEHLGLAAAQGKGLYRDNDATLLDPLAAFEEYWKKSQPRGKLRFFPPPTT